MPPKRRATRAPGGEDDEGRPVSPPAKVRKPTVAQNAQAIASLTEKINGVDTQLATMNSLLAQIASRDNSRPPPVIEIQADDSVLQPPPPTTTLPPAATTYQAPLNHQAGQFARLQPGHPPQLSRARHHTAAPDYAKTTGPPAGHPAGTTPPTAAAWSSAYHSHATTASPMQYGAAYLPAQPTNPWDHPTTVHDLEADATLTRRVAEALHAVATPFSAIQGKNAQFPHFFVTRGPKMQKTSLGELSLPEYIWGYMQMTKAKEPADQDLPFMVTHLERVAEDAKTYEWAGVRRWSEEILTKISKGHLNWNDSYSIDRLQTKISHDKPLSQHATANFSTGRKSPAPDMSDEVRSAKPGPPCKFFQLGTCTFLTDHVQNGYRQLHLCSYCLTNKCQYQPHPLSECKTKKFDKNKKSDNSSGFGK